MDAVLIEIDSRVIHTAGTNDINDVEDNSNNNRSVNSEDELSDINHDISDKSHFSILSYTSKNEIYDKTTEFDPEWDPD
jgi:hypothetical protein